ncbi:hypothetical protein PI125_g18550 [Phytophthora idaei]|nr:hypothetical protein PI125_g18550 [Phytophthora idaei]KAG3142828.1 hypothetical protein PI126_g14880 [Phytophthora idaei]
MQLQHEKSALQTDLSAARDACDDRAGQMDRLITVNADLRTERAQARDRLTGIASLQPPSVPTTQALPSWSSPARKRARSPVASQPRLPVKRSRYVAASSRPPPSTPASVSPPVLRPIDVLSAAAATQAAQSEPADNAGSTPRRRLR